MAAIELSTNSILFPVRMPGQPNEEPLSLGIWATVNASVTASIQLQGPNASAFSAEFVTQTLTEFHGLQTQSNGTTTAIPPPPSSNSLSKPSHVIQFGFTAPLTPIPGQFTATLVVSWEAGPTWPAGSTEVSLSGSSAQISAKVITPQPIKFSAGDGGKVDLELTYWSFDPTPLQVAIAPVQFPSGLTFAGKKVMITPKYESVGQNPKGQPGRVMDGPNEQLITKTVVTTTIDITSNLYNATLGKSFGYAQLLLSIPDLSGFAPAPGVQINFDVEPQPIEVKVSTKQPIVVTPGTPAPVTLSVSTKGGDTLFFIAPRTLQHGWTVGWPSGADGRIEIGSGVPTSTPITINAPVDPSATSASEVSVVLHWTAYDGLSQDDITITIRLLPSVLQFAPPGETLSYATMKVTASAVLTLYSNGNVKFTGNAVGNSSADTFSYTMIVNYAAAGTSQQALGAYIAQDLPYSWNRGGNDPFITRVWPQLCDAGSATVKLSESGDQPIIEVPTAVTEAIVWIDTYAVYGSAAAAAA